MGVLTYGSLFAGVGGFDMGFDRAGYDCRFQVEWDKNCQSILRKHWPEVPKWGDVSEVSGTELPPVDVLIFGSPCQDLSVAGKRAGLDGARSGLFHEAMRIIKEMRHATEDSFPRVVVWENVVGALSSNGGADFGTVLDQMAEAGAVVVEWAVLDAQHFGVPQRRRRVFVVAVFDPATAEGCPDPLLPVRESVRGDSAKGRKKGEAVADPVAGGVGSGGGEGAISFGNGSYGGWTETDVAVNLSARDYKGGTTAVVSDGAWWDGGRIADTLTATSDQQRMPDKQRLQAVVEPFVKSRRAQTSDDDETWIPGQVNPTLNQFDMGDTRATTAIVQPIPIQDGREIDKRQNGLGVAEPGAPAYTLDQTGAQAVAYSVREDAKANTFSATELDHANSLSALWPSPQSHHAQMFITQPLSSDTQFGSNANVFEDMTPPLKSTQQSPSIAFQPGTMIRMGGGVWDDIAPTLRAEAKRGDNEPHVAYAYDEYNDRLGGDTHHALRAGTKQSTGVVADMIVRRLTPTECERLMGWPDDHTRWTDTGKEQADTHRYRQCGNGVATPVAQWIATHLKGIL